MNFLKIIIICLLLVHSQSSYAEGLKSLSFEEAFKIGLKNNPSFKAKSGELDIRKGQLKTAKARPNPSIISDNGTAEKTYRAGISYKIELGGKRKKRTELANTAIKITEKKIDTEWLNLRADIRKAYTNLYYANKRLTILDEVIENSNRLLEIARKREAEGDIPNAEVIQAELTNLIDLQEYQNQKYIISQRHNQLEYLLNTELEENLELSEPERIGILSDESKPEDPLAYILEIAETNRPELKSNVLNQNFADQEIRLAKANRIPNLNLSAGPDIVTGTDGEFGAFFIAQIDLPIFNFQGGVIDTAKAKKEKLINEYVEMQNKIRLEIKNVYNDYIYNLTTIGNYEEKIIPKAKDVIDKAYKSFEAGKSSILVPLSAQRSYMTTEINYIETLSKYQESINTLERAIGEGL